MENIDTFSQIRRLLQKIGGRFIIVENEKPILVISTLEEYQKVFQKNKENVNPGQVGNLSETELIEKINQDINIWKEVQEEKKISNFFCQGDKNNNDLRLERIKEPGIQEII